MPFDKINYLKEMKSMVDKAIEKLQTEKSILKIYSVSIWTDPNAAASSINIDTKANSDKQVEQANSYDKKKYDEFLAEGNLEMAELFKTTAERNCNPADFILRDFIEIEHPDFDENWESESDGKCWALLIPTLTEIGEYAFEKIQSLNLENDFELAVNSDRDWYDKTWSLK
jgi:hypothetical protein